MVFDGYWWWWWWCTLHPDKFISPLECVDGASENGRFDYSINQDWWFELTNIIYTYKFWDGWRHQTKLRKMRVPKCPLFVPYCGMKTRGAYWVPGWLYGNPAGWPGMIPGHPWFYIDVRLCCVYLGCGCRDIFPYIFEYVEYSQNWMVENAGNSNFLCSKHQKTMLTWFPLDWSMKYSKQPRLSRDESIGKSC